MDHGQKKTALILGMVAICGKTQRRWGNGKSGRDGTVLRLILDEIMRTQKKAAQAEGRKKRNSQDGE